MRDLTQIVKDMRDDIIQLRDEGKQEEAQRLQHYYTEITRWRGGSAHWEESWDRLEAVAEAAEEVASRR